jgi:hypothetical protein
VAAQFALATGSGKISFSNSVNIALALANEVIDPQFTRAVADITSAFTSQIPLGTTTNNDLVENIITQVVSKFPGSAADVLGYVEASLNGTVPQGFYLTLETLAENAATTSINLGILHLTASQADGYINDAYNDVIGNTGDYAGAGPTGSINPDETPVQNM